MALEELQNELEMALGGRPVTYPFEKRGGFPVGIRYAGASREDEDSIRRLLISPQMSDAQARSASEGPGRMLPSAMPTSTHTVSTTHTAQRPLIPLSAVADIRVVEGPAMIKSENGRLLNCVTLN